MRSTIALAAVTGGAVACDTTQLATCQATMTAVTGQGIAVGKNALCTAMTDYETCLKTSGLGCDAVSVQTFQDAVTATRSSLAGTYGVDCLKMGLTTTIQLMSGDSGSPSGSTPTRSSGSTSGMLPWQLLLLVCCCCLCLGGGIGAGAYAMSKSKNKKKPKSAPREEVFQETMPLQQPPQEAPMASVAVDVNHDGRPDVVVTGVDKNRDGIPDVLQGDNNAPAKVEPVQQPAQEPVPAMVPIQQTVAEPYTTTYTQPAQFSTLEPLLPGPTTTSYAPTITSNYQPYGAYNTVYPAASTYTPAYSSTYAASPTYAATTYAAPTTYTAGGYYR